METVLIKNPTEFDIPVKTEIKSIVGIELDENITVESVPESEIQSELPVKNEPEANVLMMSEPEAVWIKSEHETGQETELEFEEMKIEGCKVRIRDVPIPKFEPIPVPIPILNFKAKPIPILNRYRYLNFLVLKLFMYFTNIMFNKSLLYSYMIFVPYRLLVCIIKLIINYNTFNSI